MITQKRAVVTGMGLVTALGVGVESFFQAMRDGRSAIGLLEGIPISRGKNLAGQIKSGEFQGTTRLAQMLYSSVEEALSQSRLPLAEDEPVNIYLATVAGESRMLEDMFLQFNNGHQSSALLREALVRYPNWALADLVAERFGFRGARVVNTNACASGNIALAQAVCAIRLGQVRRAIVCGADQLKASMYWGAERAGFIGHDLRPFHKERDGSILGEGAAALVIEEAAAADLRGIVPLAEVAGWCVTCDENPHYILAQSDGGSNARAIAGALEDSGLPPAAVGYFNSHGTGTVNIDRLETLACKHVFGEHARRIPISATKSLTGHLSAASPLVEAIASILTITRAYVHPTAKLDVVDPELDLDYVPVHGREMSVSCAVSNSMGGGGSNAVVVLTEPGLVPEHNFSPPSDQEIVISGMGAITSLGEGAETLWQSLFERAAALDIEASSYRPIPNFDITKYCARSLQYQYLNRAAQLALASAMLAAKSGGLETPLPRPERVAVIFGSAYGGTTTWGRILCECLVSNPRRITPNMALDHGHHLGVTLIARTYGVTGLTCTLTSGPIAGLQAISFGCDLIRLGVCDMALVGGVDMLDESFRQGMKLLGVSNGATPLDAHALPDAYSRAGHHVALGEGAGCLILERRTSAERRGVRARACVRGYGEAGVPCGAGRYDVHGQSILQAMKMALQNQPPDAQQLLIMGAANGVPAVGAAERRAVSRLALPSGITPRLTSIHGTLGDTQAAGGILSAIVAIQSLEQGVVAGMQGLEVPAKKGIEFIKGSARLPEACCALVNAIAPGGTASSLLLSMLAKGSGNDT